MSETESVAPSDQNPTEPSSSSKNSIVLNIVGLVIIPTIGFVIFLIYVFSGLHKIEKTTRDVNSLGTVDANYLVLQQTAQSFQNLLSVVDQFASPQTQIATQMSQFKKSAEVVKSSLNTFYQPLYDNVLAIQKSTNTLLAFYDKRDALRNATNVDGERLSWLNTQIIDQKQQIQDLIETFQTTFKKAHIYQKNLVAGKMGTLSNQSMSQLMVLGLIAAICLVGFCIISYLVAKRISAPISFIRNKMESFNKGYINDSIDGLNRKDEFGDIARLLFAFRENAQNIRNLQTKLKHTIQAKRRSVQVKEGVLLQMGQDIKKPLNTIMGFNETLQKDMKIAQQTGKIDFDRVVGQLDSMEQTGHGLMGMIDSVIDLTEESGSDSIEITTFNVREEIQQILPQVEVDVLRNQNKFRVVCPDPTLSMASDSRKLKKALGCLIKNASAATETGTITLEIHKSNLGDLEAIKFSVLDNGSGLDHERIKDLNNTLNQDDFDIYNISRMKSKSGSISKTGLGLVVVKKAIKDLLGTITAERNRIKGTKITIAFPANHKLAAERRSGLQLPNLSDAV